METITEVVMVFTTNTIKNFTNHQLLTNKTSTFNGFYCVLGHIPLRFNDLTSHQYRTTIYPQGQLQFTLKPIEFPLHQLFYFRFRFFSFIFFTIITVL